MDAVARFDQGLGAGKPNMPAPMIAMALLLLLSVGLGVLMGIQSL
jgi:hypothetical protein